MAGHSKWANIKHKKAATDAKRGKIWTRLIREITVAARIGGGDSLSNPRLRLAMDKAMGANMPKDNINRAIQRGVGGADGANYEEIRYEGYGPGGVALIIDCLTDNRTRTVAEIRHLLNKHGGNLGQDGSVAFQFVQAGQFIFAPGKVEDELIEIVAEVGDGNDMVKLTDDSIEISCSPNDFNALKQALDKAGHFADDASIVMKPNTVISLTEENDEKIQKIIDMLENLDDVQEVLTNAELVGSGE